MVTPKLLRAAGRRGGRLQSRRARLALAMGAGIMALLCLGGVSLIFVLYDDKTEIKRTAPDAVVDNFLGAYFVSRNDSEVALYQCQGGGSFAEISAYRSDIQGREQARSVGIAVTWSTFTVAVNGNSGTVTTDLTKATSNGNESITEPWRFDVVNQDGWRVCGAAPL